MKLPRLPESKPTSLRSIKSIDSPHACELGDEVLILLLAYAGLRIGEALPLRRRHLDVAEGKVIVETAVSELPGGPIIDTPKDHQRRELAVPAFVVDRVRHLLRELPASPDAFVFPGRQKHTAIASRAITAFGHGSSGRPWPSGSRT